MPIPRRDFYCGAALMQVMKPGEPFELMEMSNSTVLVSRNKGTKDEETLYVKYRSEPERGSRWCWNFTFSKDEMERVKQLQETYPNLSFVFICGKNDWMESEIARFSIEQAMTCLHPFHERPSYRISIQKNAGGKGIKMYGTGVCVSNAVRI